MDTWNDSWQQSRDAALAEQQLNEIRSHERWLAEMVADYRLEADPHPVSQRLAINGLIHSLKTHSNLLIAANEGLRSENERLRAQLRFGWECAGISPDSGVALDKPHKFGSYIRARVERMEHGLNLVLGDGCRKFTRGWCGGPGMGVTKDAEFYADRWCDACIAFDALKDE